MTEQVGPSVISAADWAATPPAVRTLVQEQGARIARLEKRLAALDERVQQTSRPSSRPPSSDPPRASRRRTQAPSGRPTGGQVGHVGHGRRLLPPERVDQIVEVKPEACAQLRGGVGRRGRGAGAASSGRTAA